MALLFNEIYSCVNTWSAMRLKRENNKKAVREFLLHFFAIIVNTITEVKEMSQNYADLNDLIRDDYEAKEFFYSLPDYVKDHIRQRADQVNSLASLQDYAENLLRGDT